MKNRDWVIIKAHGDPLRLINLYEGLAAANAGCMIDSVRKTKRTTHITIVIKPEFDCAVKNSADALIKLRQYAQFARSA
jgi:hypothetical protein